MTPREGIAGSPELHIGAPAGSPDAFERFGWTIQAIWLMFLIFPLVALFGEPLSVGQRLIGLALITAFAIVYLVGGTRMIRFRNHLGNVHPISFVLVLVLIALAGMLYPLIHFQAFGLMPFIVSFSMFTLPLIPAFGVAVTAVIVTFLAMRAWADQAGGWIISITVLCVGVMTGALRMILDRSIEADHFKSQLALVAERERVARDVHDVLGHSLTVLAVKAELAERMLDRDLGRARSELVEIQALSRSALAEIRATVGGLRVARLEEEVDGARLALQGKGIDAHVPIDVTVVDPRHRIIFAWVLREAVTNVIRHSGASRCIVELSSNRISVADNGVGVSRGNSEGTGIRGLRERVEAAGGTLVVGDHDGVGTRVEAIL